MSGVSKYIKQEILFPIISSSPVYFVIFFRSMAILFNANVLDNLVIDLEIILSEFGMSCPNLKRVMFHIFVGQR